jgi:hypothetical protein
MELLVHHHMGIGDHIALNGLVHTLLEDGNCSKLYLFCKERYRRMFRDLYPDERLVLIGVPDDNEMAFVNAYSKSKPNIPLLRIGFDKYIPKEGVTCDLEFYALAHVPYENRFTRFRMRRDQEQEERVYRKLNPNNEEYIFVHDDPSRGYSININTPYKIIRNDPTESVFHYGLVIERAKEFHCIESCFRCLAETLNTEFVRLVHHNSVRKNIISSQKNWETR